MVDAGANPEVTSAKMTEDDIDLVMKRSTNEQNRNQRGILILV